MAWISGKRIDTKGEIIMPEEQSGGKIAADVAKKSAELGKATLQGEPKAVGKIAADIGAKSAQSLAGQVSGASAKQGIGR